MQVLDDVEGYVQVQEQRAMAEPNTNFLTQLEAMERGGVFDNL